MHHASAVKAWLIFLHPDVNPDNILYLSERFYKLAQNNVGAGILFICTDNKTALLLQRSSKVSEPGVWGLPGGAAEAGEEPSEAAIREAKEELGTLPHGAKLIDTLVNKDENGEYHIFIMDISKEEKDSWTPTITLNYESSQFAWFRIGELPENLHSGIRIIQD